MDPIFGSLIKALQAASSKAPSHFAMIKVATAFPSILVIERASDMKRSTPMRTPNPLAGRRCEDWTVAASLTKPAPETAAPPFDVKRRMTRMPTVGPGTGACRSLAT